jgi:predicted metal-dependent hydrolase
MVKNLLNTSRYSFQTEGETFPIIIKRHARSRHMVIRYRAKDRVLALTLPRWVTIREGLRFVESRRVWILKQVDAHGASVPLADGGTVSVLGKALCIRHEAGRGLARIEGDALIVTGDREFLPRRVQDFLKRTAREEIVPLAMAKAEILQRKIKKISFRDTVSMWGSCGHDAQLSFSWRLVLAPREVMEYVVCHEVAHLVELNHSAAFWKIVAELCPGWEAHKQWLKAHGHSLHTH